MVETFWNKWHAYDTSSRRNVVYWLIRSSYYVKNLYFLWNPYLKYAHTKMSYLLHKNTGFSINKGIHSMQSAREKFPYTFKNNICETVYTFYFCDLLKIFRLEYCVRLPKKSSLFVNGMSFRFKLRKVKTKELNFNSLFLFSGFCFWQNLLPSDSVHRICVNRYVCILQSLVGS